MQSINLLPEIQKLPGEIQRRPRSFRDHIAGLIETDRTFQAAETASATSFGLWSIFDNINVDDNLGEAYRMAYPNLAADHSLYEHWLLMTESGDQSMTGFISGLKGKLAEIQVADQLEQNGFSNVEIAVSPTQPVWDISAVNEFGEKVFFQLKTGAEEYAGDVIDALADNPGVAFLVSSEIYQQISEAVPDLANRITDIGFDYLLVEGIEDGLGTLSSNLGIDIPDGVGDILPYAGAIIAGARLIYSVVKTEKEFKAADRTTKNKIQVVQSLTIMSRIGVTTALATAGGMGGGAVGSIVPGVGNLVGGIVGSLGGAGMGMYLNKHLQPHMLNLALNITGLTNDDLFYYKNKVRVDGVAASYQNTARELAAVPAW